MTEGGAVRRAVDQHPGFRFRDGLPRRRLWIRDGRRAHVGGPASKGAVMNGKALVLAICGSLLAASVYAQDLAGDWQGAIQAGTLQLRLIVRFKPADGGGWTGTMRSIDQGNDWGLGTAINSVTLQDGQLKFAVDQVRGKYEGKLTADASTIEGT